MTKKSTIKSDLGLVRAGWVTLLETKLGAVDGGLVNQASRYGDQAFSFLASSGLARGILCCLNKTVF